VFVSGLEFSHESFSVQYTKVVVVTGEGDGWATTSGWTILLPIAGPLL
jgi:hypothetical protein